MEQGLERVNGDIYRACVTVAKLLDCDDLKDT